MEVRTLTLSVTGSVLVFTKYTAQPEAHIPVYVHMHLYREHINILGGGGHTKDGRSIFGMLWEGHTPRPSTGWVSFGTLNVAPLMIDTKEFPEIKTTRAYARGDDRGPVWVPTLQYRRTSCSRGARGFSSPEPRLQRAAPAVCRGLTQEPPCLLSRPERHHTAFHPRPCRVYCPPCLRSRRCLLVTND